MLDMLYYINSKYTGVENIVGLKENKIRTQIILDKQVKEELQKMAEEDSRSLSNMVNKILKDYIAQRKDSN